MRLSIVLFGAVLLAGGTPVFVPADDARADDAPPAGAPADVAPARELALGIKALLDEGFDVGPKSMQAAQKRHLALRRKAGDDPRLEYAFGLVLLRQARHKPAVAQFEEVVERRGTAYWPAWQALIWGHLVDRQYEKGLNRLVEYAALVQGAANEKTIGDPEREAARWMGQVLESLDRTVTTKALHEQIDTYETRLRETLGDDLYDAFDLGRDIVEEREFELREQAGLARDANDKKNERRRKSASGKLQSDLEELDKVKDATAQSADDWKKWLDDTLSKADKQLGLLEKDYKFLEQRAQSLDRSITMLGQELTVLQLQGTASRSPNQQFQNEQRLIQAQNQMFNYQLEYNAMIGRMMQTAQKGRIAMQQRAAIVQKYEKATGELVKKSADLDKWSARLNNKKQKIDVQQAGAKKAKGGKAQQARKIAISFKSLVPLDLEVERARLLDSLGATPEEPGENADVKADRKKPANGQG